MPKFSVEIQAERIWVGEIEAEDEDEAKEKVEGISIEDFLETDEGQEFHDNPGTINVYYTPIDE